MRLIGELKQELIPRMIKTFTPTSFKKLSKQESSGGDDLPEQEFYDSIKPKLNELYRNPSEETITNILKYARKKR